MKPFQLPATLTSVRYTADGGLSVGFHTQELTSEEKLLVGDYHNKFGQLLFRPNQDQFTEEEVPSEDIDFEGKKPSQRLRAVIYRYWESKGSSGDFEVFYRQEMEKVINLFKERLPRN
ncbi:MAG: hypothetical protein ACLGJB_17715 [Blastocatellia bacterium]